MVVPDQDLQFGDFKLELGRRRLLEHGKPVRLGSRALEILIVLVSRPGETVSKDDLIARVWPETTVDDANLRVHVAALRKALGEDRSAQPNFIANIPGRGYAFIGAMTERLVEPSASDVAPLSATSSDNLPTLRSRVFGRDETIDALVEQLGTRGFISLVGPGGIGKTTVAIAVAHRLERSYEDGRHFVDLAPVTDPALVPSAIAASLGLSVTAETALVSVVACLRGQRKLLLLDNCEHVIEAAALAAEDIFRNAPDVHLLVTSREAMRVEGEYVHRLTPLDLPPSGAVKTHVEIMRFPAVQLFAERATARGDDFTISAEEAAIVADLCRRLDGIPLAIEFAAARVDQFGIQGLAQRLDDRFQILTKGRRTALPRHQTLRATLDWSYQTLSAAEQVILQRISVFPGFFSLDAAQAVVGTDRLDGDIHDYVAALAMKSLVVVNRVGAETQYRLLETTRAYALSKLKETGESRAVLRRHADYCCAICETAEAEWQNLAAADWLDAYGGRIDDIRAALDWALSADGDPQISLSLAASSAPVWYQLSLQDEFRDRAEKALAGAAKAGVDPVLETRLLIALGHSYLNTDAMFADMLVVFDRALEGARQNGKTKFEMQAIWGLWAGYNVAGEYEKAAMLAEKFGSLAESEKDRNALVIRDRMMMRSCHLLGRQAESKAYATRVLSDPVTDKSAARNTGYQLDQRTAVNAVLARVLWLQGYPDQALALARDLVSHALAVGHMYSLCYGLAVGACPVALFAGDTAQATAWAALLRERSLKSAFTYWKRWADCFDLALDDGATAIPAGLMFGTTHHECLAVTQAALVPERVLAPLCETGRRWCAPELLRIAGSRLLQAGRMSEADALFGQALRMAREQGAASWELRVADSIARLRQQQDRGAEAKALLEEVYGRFSEGFGTADLRRAEALLKIL